MPEPLAVERLAPAEDETVRRTLRLEFERRGELYSDLSRVAKREEAVGKHHLDALWSRVVDGVFVVCGRVRRA